MDQYHEEAGGKGPRSKTVINLAYFHLADHLAGLEVYFNKRPKEAEARRQVSVFYSGGDYERPHHGRAMAELADGGQAEVQGGGKSMSVPLLD